MDEINLFVHEEHSLLSNPRTVLQWLSVRIFLVAFQTELEKKTFLIHNHFKTFLQTSQK